jgi:hypothetical protein
MTADPPTDAEVRAAQLVLARAHLAKLEELAGLTAELERLRAERDSTP